MSRKSGILIPAGALGVTTCKANVAPALKLFEALRP